MAVVEVSEAMDSLADWQETEQGVRATRIQIVKTDDWRDGPLTVLSANGVMQVGEAYQFGNEASANVVCLRRRPRRPDRTAKIWRIESELGSPARNGTGLESKEIDPVFETPDVQIGTATDQEVMLTDRTGSRVENTAGQRWYDLRKEIKFGTLSITRNEPLSTDILAKKAAFEGRTNSTTWWGKPADYWLCGGISATYATRTSPSGWMVFRYLKVTYQFGGKEGLWVERRRNEGWYYLNDEGEKVQFESRQGGGIDGNLTVSGGKLADDLEPVELIFYPYEQADFNALALPQSMTEAGF
jgi:hypothetical protein